MLAFAFKGKQLKHFKLSALHPEAFEFFYISDCEHHAFVALDLPRITPDESLVLIFISDPYQANGESEYSTASIFHEVGLRSLRIPMCGQLSQPRFRHPGTPKSEPSTSYSRSDKVCVLCGLSLRGAEVGKRTCGRTCWTWKVRALRVPYQNLLQIYPRRWNCSLQALHHHIVNSSTFQIFWGSFPQRSWTCLLVARTCGRAWLSLRGAEVKDT